MTRNKRSRWSLFSPNSREARTRRWRDAFPRFLPLVGGAADGVVHSLVGFCRRLFARLASRPLRHNLTWTQHVAAMEPLEDRRLLAASISSATFGVVQVGEQNDTVDVNIATAAGTEMLDAWVDFNRDGSFNGLGEKIANQLAVASGTSTPTVTFDVPADAVSGVALDARFRVSTAAGGPDAAAVDGEVVNDAVTLNDPGGFDGFLFGSGFSGAANNNPDIKNNTLRLGDMNGDGHLDAVAKLRSSRTGTFLNDGAGSLVFHEQFSNVGGSTGTALGDIDGDGDPDAVITTVAAARTFVNDGTGNLTELIQTTPLPFRVGGSEPAWHDAKLGDFDGDGDLDLVLVGHNRFFGGLSQVFTNDGTGQFTDTLQDLHQGAHVELGDVDKDGDLDVLIGGRHYGGNRSFYLQRNDGAGTFGASYAIGAQGISARLGDLDGDGLLDVVVAHGRNFRNPTSDHFVLLNLGTATGNPFAVSQRLPRLVGSTGDLDLGDVDGDGDLDVWEGNAFTESRVWLNDASGTFGDSGQLLFRTDVTEVELGDIDGDGDLDAVTVDGRGGSVFLNQPIIAITPVDADKLEGNTGSTPSTAFTFDVTRSTGDLTADVNFAVSGDGPNPANAADFGGSFPTGTVSFGVGVSSVPLTISVTGDTDVELNEGFKVTLSNVVAPTPYALLSTAVGTIQNEDVPNTPPIVSTNTALTVNEGSTANAVGTSRLETTDAEQAAAALTYTLDTIPTVGTLYLDNDGNNVPTDASEILAATETFTQADIDANRLKYDHDGSETTSASFQFDVSDGVASVDNQVFNITITPVNDAPAGADNTLTTDEDSTLEFAVADFGFSDPDDSPANNFNRVKITTLPTAGTLKLNGTPISAGDFVTKAQLDAIQLTFDPAADENGTPYATFTFQVEDDGGTAGGGENLDASPNTITINVNSIDDPPVLTGGGPPVTYVEADPAEPVDPNLTLTDADAGATLDGASATITGNFFAGQDLLEFTNQNGISGSYNAASGVLTLTGTASVADYEAALRSVAYRNSSLDPDASPRTVTFTLSTALANPDNGHFYEFVSAPAIRWDDARAAADNLMLFGLQGYLATITSADENAFAASKLQGQGWIGATDAASDGIWRWVAGPEGAEDGGQGRHFWTQPIGGIGGSTVGGYYANWAPNEPNDYPDANPGREDYAHFRTDGRWNDYSINNGSIQGFVVEYGGTASDPILSLTSSNIVNVVPVNDDPVANDDGFSTSEDNALTTQKVLNNDTDVDGGALSVSKVNGSTPNVGTQITLGSGALLTVQSNGTFAYDPNGQFESLGVGDTATETFTYQTSDGNGGFDTATVTITINGANDSPVALDDGAATDEDTPVTVAAPGVLANDSDIDGDDLGVISVDTSATVGLVTINSSGSQVAGGLTGHYIDLNENVPLVGNRTNSNDRLFREFTADGEFVLQRLGLMASAAGVITSYVDFGAGTETVAGDGSVLDRGGTGGLLWGGLLGAGATDVDQIAGTWSGKIEITTPGKYTFTTRSDDGSVVFINGKLVTNNNQFQGMTNRSGSVFLTAGLHDISIGMYEGGGGAGMQASYTGPDTLGKRVIVPPSVLYNDVASSGTFVSGGLRGNYYDLNNTPNTMFAEEYLVFATEADDHIVMDTLRTAATQFTTRIDFGGGTEAVPGDGTVLNRGGTGGNPYGGIGVVIDPAQPTDQLGAIWDGFLVVPETANYQFTTRSDDFSRVFVVINNDGDFGDANELVASKPAGGMNNVSGAVVTLAAGLHRFKAATAEGGGGAGMQVSWQQLTGASPFSRQIIAPESFIADLGDGGYSYDPNGQFDYLAPGDMATDSFDYTISDGNGGTATATVTITIDGVNDLPVAVCDLGTTAEDTVLNVSAAAGLLSNDSDVDDGDSISALEVNGVAANIGTQFTLPSGALLTVLGDGSYDYDPNGQFDSLGTGDSATDSFDYTIVDTYGATATSTAFITITGVSRVSVSDASVLEGDTGDGNQLVFNVTLDSAASRDVVVDYQTQNSTAIAGQDYTGTSGTVTIPAGSLFAQVKIDVTGEELVELNEALTLDIALGSVPLGGVVTDLALWLDAGDINANGTSLADGTAVTTWQDKSGNDRDLVLGGGAGNDPNFILSSPTANNQSAVLFDGNDQMIGQDNFDTILGDNYTIITMSRYAGDLNDAGDYERLISSDTTNWLFGYWAQDQERWFANGWIYQGTRDAHINQENDWNLHTGILGPDINGIVGEFAGNPGADFWRNGLQLADDSQGSSNTAYKPGVLSLGARTNNNQESSVGEVAEVIIYDRVLSNTERQAVENYLYSKYDVLRVDVADGSGQGTIENDDTAVLSINDVSLAENGTFTFTITSSNPTDTDITGTIDTANIALQALAGTDYTGIVGATFTILGDSSDLSDTVTVTVNDDNIVEDDETFHVNLSAAKFGGATDATRATFTGGDNQGLGTIENDDSATVSIANVNDANETGSVPGKFEVTQTALSSADTDVSYNVLVSSTATDGGTDYTTLSGTVTIPAGSLTADIDVTGIDDDLLIEGDETVVVQLTGITGGHTASISVNINNDTATVNIIDNDTATWSLTGDSTVAEGASASYTVSLSGALGAGEDASIDITLSDVDTTSTDYANFVATVTAAVGAYAGSGTLTFDGVDTLTFTATNDGDTMTDLAISLGATADSLVEADEDYTVDLATPSSTTGADIALDGSNDSVTTTITSVDAGAWSLTGDSTVAEGSSAGYTVSLSGSYGAGESTSIDIGLSDVDTTSTDYASFVAAVTAAANANSAVTFDGVDTLTFTATNDGDSMADLVVSLGATADGLVEADEDYQVDLANAASSSGDVTGSGSQTTTITSADAAAWSLTGDATVAEGAAASYTVSLSGTYGAGEDASIDLTQSDIDTTGTDYANFVAAVNAAIGTRTDLSFDGTTLTYTAASDGDSMANLDISLGASDDALVEGDQDYAVDLANPASTAGADVALDAVANSVTTTITDNDTAVFTIDNRIVNESAGTMSFTVSLSNPIEGIDVDVDVTYTDVSATGSAGGAGADYDNGADQVTFLAGSTTSQTVAVGITSDLLVEPDETFSASLSSTTDWGTRLSNLSDTGTGTILNDDYLGGRVFDDLDNDGVYEPADGDAGIGGVTVQLVNQTTGAVADTEVTAADGSFTFDVTVPAGTYKIVEVVDELSDLGLLDGIETAGVNGGTVDNSQDSNEITDIEIGGAGPAAEAVDYLFAEIQPSDAFGSVWEDFNNDGEINFGEAGIDNALVELTGTDDRGNPVSLSDLTSGDGSYAFIHLRPGTYSVAETQPAGFDDGLESLGEVTDLGVPTAVADPGFIDGNDKFSGIQLVPGSEGDMYNFGERPQAAGEIGDSVTATIGFWHNKNGQNLIKSLNGDANSTQLGDWLAATFPAMYGPGAFYDAAKGADQDMDLTGKTNAEIADIFKYLHKRNKKTAVAGGPPKVDAQVLAVALATYATSENLAGSNYAASYGFNTTADGIGYTTFNVLDVMTAQEADDLGLTPSMDASGNVIIIDLLLATNDKAADGLMYDADDSGSISNFEKMLRTLANDLYTAINEGSDI